MWQRFSESARRLVYFAQEEARKLEDSKVRPEHLLLAMTRDSNNVAAVILHRMGLPLTTLRVQLIFVVSPGASGQAAAVRDLQLSDDAKRAIDLSYEEAKQLNNTYIGTEHLLAGILRLGEGPAAKALAGLGIDIAGVRRHILAYEEPEPGETPDAEESLKGEALRALLMQQAGKFKATEGLCIGDIGVATPANGQSQVMMARDRAAYDQLALAFQAKDAYGYQALLAEDRAIAFLTEGTPLKLLATSASEGSLSPLPGHHVRVLDGEHAGAAGWLFAESFSRTGSDASTFPPQ